jgi:hypothetical protein
MYVCVYVCVCCPNRVCACLGLSCEVFVESQRIVEMSSRPQWVKRGGSESGKETEETSREKQKY